LVFEADLPIFRLMDNTDRMRKLGSVVAGGKRVALALGSAGLLSLCLVACSGADSGSAAADVPRVGLMHVGTDHTPPSFGALARQLDEKYGWDLPEAEVTRCSDTKVLVKSCDIHGPKVELLWRNLGPGEADRQAHVFVRQGIDVIVAFEDTSISAAQRATAGMPHPTPIVFLHPSDPVRDGLTGSLNRPDRNLTGVFGARDVVAKQLELYQLLVPKLHTVLTLVDPTDPRTELLLAEYKTAAAGLQRPVALDIREATTAKDLKRVFRSLKSGEDGAFLLSPSLRLNHTALTIQLARKAGIPVQAHRKEWVEQGALFSYGTDLAPVGRAGARYVDSLLKGVSPADLPVQEIPTVEFAINLKTANRLGIKVPQGMIIRADEVYR
jgi:putative tryptophan/tyrosine transport system substrate-binding protein